MSIITDPFGVSADPKYGGEDYPFENNSASVAIATYDLVVWVWDEATLKLKVKLADVSADDPALIAGVAQEPIPASGAGLVRTHGYSLVNIGDGTVAAGERAGFHATTDGAADSAAADATTISGDTFGVMLGDEIGTTNRAPVWID